MRYLQKNFLKLVVLQLVLLGVLVVAVPPAAHALPSHIVAAAGGGQPGHCTDSNNCDLVALYVNPFIRVLSIIVGLVVAASLIMGGIQYSAAGGDPQKTSAAKNRITNTLLAFLAYAFLYAFLNFLVPGGIFNK